MIQHVSFEAKLSVELAFFAVCRITTTSPDMSNGESGTGFLMCINFNQPTARLLIITNKHIVNDPRYNVNISLNQRNGEGKVLLGERTSLDIKNFHNFYQKHARHDLALIDITDEVWRPGGPYTKYFDSDEVFLDSGGLWPGMDIFYIGYPDGRFDTYHNLPLVRSGIIASYPSLDYDGLPQFLIDTHAFQGSSGSPVLTYHQNKMSLIGIFTELIDSSRSTNLGSHASIDYTVPLGLGYVLKSHIIAELIAEYKARKGI